MANVEVDDLVLGFMPHAVGSCDHTTSRLTMITVPNWPEGEPSSLVVNSAAVIQLQRVQILTPAPHCHAGDFTTWTVKCSSHGIGNRVLKKFGPRALGF